MSEEHKTERTRSWQAASPAACCSVLSLSSRRQQLSVSRLHSVDCYHRSQSLWAQGRPLRARGGWGNPVLKGHTAAVSALRAAHGDLQEPTGPKRREPLETAGKSLDGELAHKNATHSPSFLSFNLHNRLTGEVSK